MGKQPATSAATGGNLAGCAGCVAKSTNTCYICGHNPGVTMARSCLDCSIHRHLTAKDSPAASRLHNQARYVTCTALSPRYRLIVHISEARTCTCFIPHEPTRDLEPIRPTDPEDERPWSPASIARELGVLGARRPSDLE